MGLRGLEPRTSTLSVLRSNHLSYKPRSLPLKLEKTNNIASTDRSRKEVIQPHLPVRLPCYDLSPVTSFALGGSSRIPTSGTPSSHGLTGGVYKARERIHRSIADLRLLANPTSRGRVADLYPNCEWLFEIGILLLSSCPLYHPL